MEKLTREDVEFSYGIPITVEQFFKVNKVGMYPTNGVQQIHIKSGDITPKNSKIGNIPFPKIFIRVINQKVDRTQLDPYYHGLLSSVICTSYTTYVDS